MKNQPKCSAPAPGETYRQPIASQPLRALLGAAATTIAALLAPPAFAAPLGTPTLAAGQNILQESGEVIAGGATYTVIRYTWRDSVGDPRSVSLLPASASTSGYAVQMSYVLTDGGVKRTAYINAPNQFDGGFGYFVSHELYRTFSNGGSAPIAALHGEDDSPLGRYLPSTGTSQSVGQTQATHEFRLDYPHWGTVGAVPDPSTTVIPIDGAAHQKFILPVVIRWHFVSGQDYPIWSVNYDISAASDRISIDVRGPYGVMYFNEGTGPAVTALRWGDKYRFTADAGAADFGTTALPAGGLPWTWNVLNTGRRYNVLGAGTYEFGIVDTRPYATSLYGDGYANGRNSTSVVAAPCTYGMLSMPCDWEWAYQSIEFSYGPPTTPKIAWKSSPFLGSSLTTVYTGPGQPQTISPQGNIHYGTHIVFGRSGTGTPLALAKANATIETNPQLFLTPSPVAGGTLGYTVLGNPNPPSLVSGQILAPWDSVKLIATPNAGYMLQSWTGPCAGVVGTECVVTMNQTHTVGANFVVGTQPPANDNFAGRTTLSGASVTVTRNTAAATVEAGEPMHLAGVPNTHSIWFAWTPPSGSGSGPVSITTLGSDFDTVLAVYTGPGVPTVSTLTQIAANDDATGQVSSAVVINAVIGQTYYIAVDGYSGASGNVTLNVTLRGKSDDLNGDGKSDLLFRDTSTGEVQAKLMNGSTVLSGAGLVGAGAWTVAHRADFNKDGKADLVWRNTNGTTILWLMNGTNAVSSAVLLGADPSWTITHIADLNGDGRADILWRNANGAVIAWLMDGTTVTSTAVLLGVDPDWRITHTGDYNSDGKADLLWRHTNGAVTQWLMNGTSVTTNTSLLGADPDWRVSHVGDFNGDGKTDLLWRHNTNGAVIQWLMNGATVTTSTSLLGADPDWRVSHVGDFDGNSRADILWRHTNGAVTQWLMNGATVAASAALLGPDPAWRVSHLADYNGDGKTDLLWRNTADGSINMWLMSGSALISGAGILGPSPWVVIP